MNRPPDPPGAPFGIFLAAGAIWSAALALYCGLLLAPGPPTAGSRVALALVALFLTLAVGTAATLISGLVHRLPVARRMPRLFDLVQAAVVGCAAGFGFLSLVKFRATHSHLGWNDLRFLLGSLGQVVAEAGRRERFLVWMALLLPLGVTLVAYASFRRARRSPPPAPAHLAALFAVAIAGLLALAWRQPYARYVLTAVEPTVSAIVRVVHTPPHDAIARRPFVPDPVRERRIVPWVAPPGFRRANVVVLMLESIPWSRLFGPEARPESTPQLLDLSRQSVVFSRAYATATHSDYAQTSILASLHPRKFERHDYFTDLSYPRTLLWDLFRPLGYRTAVFSCQNENWGNMRSFLVTPGLDLFRHSPDWPEAPRRGDGPESKVFESTPVDAFLDWVAEDTARPFAVYLNFQATHYPYVVPPGEPEPYQPSTIDFPTTFLDYPRDRIGVMENRFHNALAYVDRQTARVVRGLEAAGIWENTALLVVSDHGEAFYEHGLPTHGTTLYEEQVRTAMFLRLPGTPPRVVESPVSVLDAVPVIVRALGLPPHGNLQGRDDILEPGYDGSRRLLPFTIQGITREDGLLAGDWKYILNRDRGELALFDLAADPGERTNLAATDPERRTKLGSELDDLLAGQLAYYRDRGWESGFYPPALP